MFHRCLIWNWYGGCSTTQTRSGLCGWSNLYWEAILSRMSEQGAMGSWVWKKLLQLRSLAKQFLRMEFHSGKSVGFWTDIWHPMERLIQVIGEGYQVAGYRLLTSASPFAWLGWDFGSYSPYSTWQPCFYSFEASISSHCLLYLAWKKWRRHTQRSRPAISLQKW